MKNVIEAAGGTPDEIQIKQLMAALEGVDIKEAMKSAAAMPAASAPTPAAAPGKKEEAPAEEEEEEEAEEEALEGLGALFG